MLRLLLHCIALEITQSRLSRRHSDHETWHTGHTPVHVLQCALPEGDAKTKTYLSTQAVARAWDQPLVSC